MAKAKASAVLQPNLGIYYDRARIALNPRMLQDGLNFRVKEGFLSNINIGWERFGTFQLNGMAMLISSFIIRGGTEQLVFATLTDIYRYVSANNVRYLTPRYDTGTVTRVGNALTFVGSNLTTAGIKTNDEIHFGGLAEDAPTASWSLITNVTGALTATTADSGAIAPGTVFTIRKKFTGTKDNVWQSEIFVNASPSTKDELWMTNGLDTMVRWNGTDTQVEIMSGLGFVAKTLKVLNNMMIFANVNQGGTVKPTDLLNSDVGKPQNVGSASSGISAQFKAHGGVEEILRIEPIGDNLAIYSKNSRITLAQFVSVPLIFVFRQISNATGILSPNLLANYGNYHEFLAPDTQYYFDGATIKENNSHVWRELLRTQDAGRIQLSYSHFDQENGDLIWVVPLTTDVDLTGGPSKAASEHYLENPGPGLPTPYSRRSFPFTASGYFKRLTGLTWDQVTSQWQNTNFRWNDRFFASSFPLNLVGDQNGKIYTLNTAQNADGLALPSFVTFSRRAVFDGKMRGLVTRVYPFVTELATPLTVGVMTADSAEGSPMIVDAKSFTQSQPEGGHFSVHYRRGRYYEIEFSSDGPNQPWSISGYDVGTRPGGNR